MEPKLRINLVLESCYTALWVQVDAGEYSNSNSILTVVNMSFLKGSTPTHDV